MKITNFKIGDKVKLTGQFLRNTGQFTGGEGLSVWTVTALSKDGKVVTTDQELENLSYFTAEELADDPSLKFRRILACNLYKVGTVDSRNTL